jgi:hypothetical protein
MSDDYDQTVLLVLLEVLIIIFISITLFHLYRSMAAIYEHSILARWKLAMPGLRLCKSCRVLKRGLRDVRYQHYDSFQGLETSGRQGCWCCSIVSEQFIKSIDDHDVPLVISDLRQLKVPHLLLWFAEQTWMETGYLDHLRQIGMYRMLAFFILLYVDIEKDYFE